MKLLQRLILIAALIVLISAVFAAQAGAAPNPFIGMWHSTDIDGSNQTLTIGGGPGNTFRVRYHDDGASICGLDPDTGDFLYAASARGSLTASGDYLSGTMPVYCQTSPPSLWGTYFFEYWYDPGTDTLTDNLGVVWSH